MTRSPALVFADLDNALMRLTGLRNIVDDPDKSDVPIKELAVAMSKAVDHVLNTYVALVDADEAVMAKISVFLTTEEGRAE